MKIRKNLGFTLIELLIVIAILSILSTLGLNNFRSARIKATDASRKSDLQTIAKSLEAYANDHKSYPISTDDKITCQPDTICEWGSAFTDGVTVYIATLPGHPTTQNYIYQSDGKSYTLYTRLDNSQDPDIKTIDPSISVKCGSTTPCNYKKSSTNI